ncbi:MAG: hypothetical protein QW838_08195 [Candidatus Nitrosotenuis sp.]
MPKWSKDAKEFQVKIHYDDEKGSQIRVPKPILEKMDNPDKLRFVIEGRLIKVLPVKSSLEQASESMRLKRKAVNND